MRWGQRASWARVGTGLTRTVTPPARAAQDPRRHRVASRQVFMVAAVPERGGWVWTPRGNGGPFKEGRVTE